jgi:hypothetical protein
LPNGPARSRRAFNHFGPKTTISPRLRTPLVGS